MSASHTQTGPFESPQQALVRLHAHVQSCQRRPTCACCIPCACTAGVYDAIRKGYLKMLFFGISTDPDGTELMEVGGGTPRIHAHMRMHL